ncbi:C40 family peptidase [Streptomyces globisporus]|uniref:C40 family peptidase n=1 Tax=Streptomyces globisporus TaxID=1908 RepID=UPI00365B450E
MKTVVVGFGAFVVCLLLLAGSTMMIGSSSEAVQRTGSSGACLPGVDSDAVAQQVAAILDGASDTDVQIEGLTLPGEQIPHAQTIVAAGISLHVPRRGQIVAIATAMQESRLRNLSYGDRDSLGLFQQRPSQGWGTADQIRDPVYSAERFYKALVTVDGWEQLTVTQAAQAVQQSGYPNAYAQWENLATALQKAIATTFPSTNPKGDTAPTADASGCESGPDGSGFGTIPAGKVPKGYKIPAGTDPRARKALEWAMFQLGTMYQWGGTCTNARGPDPMGRCDCSSLMQQAYAQVGIKLTRTTYTQVNEGDPVSADKLRPGDLIFSRGSAERPEHVGMAMGAGLAIEAPRTGKPVRISPLKDWTILAVRRVL